MKKPINSGTPNTANFDDQTFFEPRKVNDDANMQSTANNKRYVLVEIRFGTKLARGDPKPSWYIFNEPVVASTEACNSTRR